MFVIIWEYQVKAEKLSEFESIYSLNDAWAALFEKSGGYLGTELLLDETNHQRYLTIDRWNSKEEYEAFMSQWETEYKELDAQCEDLTKSESLIGKWTTIV